MDLASYLQIFETVYTQRYSEFDLPEAESYRLLANRYPEPVVIGRKVPTLNDRITNRLRALADTECLEGKSFSVEDIHLLYRQAYFEYKLFGKHDLRFVSLFSVLNASTGVANKFKADKETLRNLAECTVDLWLTNRNFRNHLLGDRLDQIAAAAKRLRYISGTPIRVENGEIILSDEFLIPIQKEIERRMSLAGGLPVLTRLFREELCPRFDSNMERYMIHRQSRIYYGTKKLPGPEIPFGYLFQLAVKYIFPPVIDIRFRCGDGYEELIEMVKDVLLIFDVSKAYPMAHFSIPIQELPKYIVKNSVFENLCLPPQYAPEFCSLIIDLYKRERKRLLPSLSCFEDVARWCLVQPPCKVFSAQEVSEKTKLPLTKVQYILNLFSQPWNQVNKDYVLPIAPTNQWKYPLIQAPDSKHYFQLCPQFSGYGFCDRLYTLLFEKDNTVGRRLGKSVEALTKRLLDEKHISYHSGYYKDKKMVQGECDFILEDNKNIIFLEIKKCPLGDGFKLADDVDIFHDMADGMLAGQVQAYRHRTLLTKNGSLPLYRKDTDLNPYYILELKNRKVHTMSVCMTEYAFFTQAFLTEKFLQALLLGSFNTNDSALASKLKKLNRLALNFRELINQQKASIDDLHKYTNRSYFRSLQQLWIVLQFCQTKEQVIEHLTWDCYTMFGAMDFYAEFKEWHRIHS